MQFRKEIDNSKQLCHFFEIFLKNKKGAESQPLFYNNIVSI